MSVLDMTLNFSMTSFWVCRVPPSLPLLSDPFWLRVVVPYMILSGVGRGVMVIMVGNGYGDTSSNPGQDW